MASVAKICKDLMIEEPFYGLLLLHLKKEVTTKVDTLAVGLEGIGITLYINESFWDSMTNYEQMAVLKHELLHVGFKHLFLQKSFSNKKLFNYAADMEVNCYIQHLPESAVTVKYINDTYGTSLIENQGTSFYYQELLKLAEKNPGGELGEDPNGGVGSDHGMWKEFNDMTESEQKLVENQVDHQLKQAAEQTMKSCGNVPNELRGIIDKLLAPPPPVFNWKAYLRRALGSSIYTYIKKSRRKQSKRFPDFAGLKVKHKQHLLVGIDTSGSLSDDELVDFFNEINHIHKAGAQVTIIECDCRIGRKYLYDGKFDGKITGGGGTSFEPIVEEYNNNRQLYTTLIYFTDGYANLTNIKPMKPMMWLISSGGCEQKYPGHTIYIPKKDKK